MNELLAALALAITLEGFAYALFPGGMKKMMASMQDMPASKLRVAGLVAAFIGVGLVWLIKR
tara:strand:+ start:233 stop:418 length:186 start_codon:yes stop_codon:yes gene_type:complete